jgi:hypothetical protein
VWQPRNSLANTQAKTWTRPPFYEAKSLSHPVECRPRTYLRHQWKRESVLCTISQRCSHACCWWCVPRLSPVPATMSSSFLLNPHRDPRQLNAASDTIGLRFIVLCESDSQARCMMCSSWCRVHGFWRWIICIRRKRPSEYWKHRRGWNPPLRTRQHDGQHQRWLWNARRTWKPLKQHRRRPREDC